MNQPAAGDSFFDKGLPSNVEAERSILGAVMLDNSVCHQAIELLGRGGDLFLDSHRRIFDKMIGLTERGSVIDFITLSDELRRAGEFEQVGGATYIASLIDGVPRTDTIEHYARIVKAKAQLRRLITASNQTIARCFDGEDDPDVIIDNAAQEIARIAESSAKTIQPLVQPFGKFMATLFALAQRIGFEIRRRELCLIASITNRGKSTMLRNAALAMATGGEFFPLVEKDEPRRVLIIDFETSASRLQDDLALMTRDWPEAEKDLLRENLFIVCEAMIGDDMLSLSRHLKVIEREAHALDIDVIMVDTASAAFDLRNENDNGEVAHVALKPLLKLARKLDCGIVLAHHVGKIGSEEAKQAEKAYRSRGASAWGCYPTSVYIITAHPTDVDRVTLTCAKRKDGAEYENVLALDRKTRWFNLTNETPPPPALTNREIIRASVIAEMQKADIVSGLNGKDISIRTIENSLNKDVAEGFLVSPRRGWYAPAVLPTSATLIGDCGSGKNGNGNGNGHSKEHGYCSDCDAAGIRFSACSECGGVVR